MIHKLSAADEGAIKNMCQAHRKNKTGTSRIVKQK